MVLCVNVRTKIKDLVIEYIEVVLKNGEFVNINWDYSEIERTHEGFTAFYRGICFGEEYARDCIDKLEDLSIACIGLYFNADFIFGRDGDNKAELEFILNWAKARRAQVSGEGSI